jgi:alpha-D-ribose 1-methylphosphonate 5-triphosphate synthase subunit PhnG
MNREDLIFFLQQVAVHKLVSLAKKVEENGNVLIIQQPSTETLMVPINDPVTHGSFYAGEALVSSAIVQVNSVNGWAMVMDDRADLALTIAILDGAYGAGVEQDSIQRLAVQGKENHRQHMSKTEDKVAATKVSFDLM